MLPKAEEFAAQGAEVISVFGSSPTFDKGRKFHEDLSSKVSKATGQPETTQSAGLLAACGPPTPGVSLSPVLAKA